MIRAWVYSFLLWNRHPRSTRGGPGMSDRASQLNDNISTVFTHLGLHFLSGGTGGSERDPNVGRKPHRVKVAFVINN